MNGKIALGVAALLLASCSVEHRECSTHKVTAQDLSDFGIQASSIEADGPYSDSPYSFQGTTVSGKKVQGTVCRTADESWYLLVYGVRPL